MQQWLRKVRVTFSGSGGGVVINPGESTDVQLRVSFDVTKTISSSPNTARIAIWNLNEGHRNAVGKELDQVILEAGYIPTFGQSNVGIIFKGYMRDVIHRRDGQTDIVTELTTGDGDKAYRYGTISETFPAGTPVEYVVESIYGELEDVDRGEWIFPQNMQPFRRPYSIAGSATRHLDTLGRGRKFYWSIQNGAMEIIPSDGVLPGSVYIAKTSGMVDYPAITDNGVRVTTLLNPEIRPNRTVQIQSEFLQMNAASGIYRVSQVRFYGDNRDGDFHSEVIGESLQGETVDEGTGIRVLRALPV